MDAKLLTNSDLKNGEKIINEMKGYVIYNWNGHLKIKHGSGQFMTNETSDEPFLRFVTDEGKLLFGSVWTSKELEYKGGKCWCYEEHLEQAVEIVAKPIYKYLNEVHDDYERLADNLFKPGNNDDIYHCGFVYSDPGEVIDAKDKNSAIPDMMITETLNPPKKLSSFDKYCKIPYWDRDYTLRSQFGDLKQVRFVTNKNNSTGHRLYEFVFSEYPTTQARVETTFSSGNLEEFINNIIREKDRVISKLVGDKHRLKEITNSIYGEDNIPAKKRASEDKLYIKAYTEGYRHGFHDGLDHFTKP